MKTLATVRAGECLRRRVESLPFVIEFVGGNTHSAINAGIQSLWIDRINDIARHCWRSAGVPLTASSLRKLNASLLELAYVSLRVTLPRLPIPSLVVLKLVRGVVDQFFSRLWW